jgi:hypothetical protein
LPPTCMESLLFERINYQLLWQSGTRLIFLQHSNDLCSQLWLKKCTQLWPWKEIVSCVIL